MMVAEDETAPEPTFSTLKRQRTFIQPSGNGTDYPALQELVKPHIDSFNALFEETGAEFGASAIQTMELEGEVRPGQGMTGLLRLAVQDLPERVVFDGPRDGGLGNKLSFRVEDVSVSRPLVPERAKGVRDRRIFPTEARERLSTYTGAMSMRYSWSLNGGPRQYETRDIGALPIMVRSSKCHLRNMSSKAMVEKGEEADEAGGYFIINGNERLIRLLTLPRRNHAFAIIRPSFAKRGMDYTSFGVTMRCCRPDQSSVTNTLHYLSDGSIFLRFSWRKQEYMIPVVMILKSLTGMSDKEIFAGVSMGSHLPSRPINGQRKESAEKPSPEQGVNTFLMDRIELLLRGFKNYALYTRSQCRAYMGEKFRIVLGCSDDYTDVQVGEYLLDRVILVHLTSTEDKARLLLFMMRKLYALAGGQIAADNADAAANHEILLPGFLYGIAIKERLDEFMLGIVNQIRIDVRRSLAGLDFFDKRYIVKAVRKVPNDIGGKLSYFLATGNLLSSTGLDLQQASGFTIIAEKLNFYRYISHFRCVHRGAFFAQLKTTTVRKLLPEAWGYLCPVHTPDGAPCGLLNHLSHTCHITTKYLNVKELPNLLYSMGMTQPFTYKVDGRQNLSVHLDGRVIGWCSPNLAKRLARMLRLFKTEGRHQVPLDLEIGLVMPSKGGQYPGLYLFSSQSRMMRPVRYLVNGEIDHVGSFEQIYLDIACLPEDIHKGLTTHIEVAPTSMLSVVANLTPFSDYNQSPRNMYQCQMGKQTMGTPASAIDRRTDNKMYRIQSSQTPIVRPKLHDTYGMDGYPNGCNAVVAVISYTGYDMEDAMIINKSAHDRGFGYGTIYKTETYDLRDISKSDARKALEVHFGFGDDVPLDHQWRSKLEDDGIVWIGKKVTDGDPICAWYDEVSGITHLCKYKSSEDGIVDQVRILGNDTGDLECTKINVKFRLPRAPVIGDKFSSRHGQKGVCSQKWPAIDMPFSESGLQPDVIINPHAFPSRMTIGMFIESLAGKAGALHGIAQDATPFKFTEDDTPAAYFGEQLRRAGFNHAGNEPMYSGVTGTELYADIYIGLVYYQRLRHMVGDKYQVRTTGPIDPLTRQPVKGRKRAGGIRFGEMERDALIAHGCSFLLQDRLMNCSDYHLCKICRRCGSMLSLGFADEDRQVRQSRYRDVLGGGFEECRACRKEDERVEYSRTIQNDTKRLHDSADVKMVLPRQNLRMLQMKSRDLEVIAVPYVLKYLTTELAMMNIRLAFEVR